MNPRLLISSFLLLSLQGFGQNQSNSIYSFTDEIEYYVNFNQTGYFDTTNINFLKKQLKDTVKLRKSTYRKYETFDFTGYKKPPIFKQSSADIAILYVKEQEPKIDGLWFNETWEIDTISFQFIKKINYNAPYDDVYVFDGEKNVLKGSRPWYILDNSTKNNAQSNFVKIACNLVSTVRIVGYDPCIEDPLENIFSKKRDEFFKIILKGILESKVIALDTLSKQQISKKWAIELFCTSDTLIEVQPKNIDGTLSFYPSNSISSVKWTEPYKKDSLFRFEVFRLVHDISDIRAIRFIENWYINIETLEFKKEVIAFAPVLEYGFFPKRKFRTLFWIYPKK